LNDVEIERLRTVVKPHRLPSGQVIFAEMESFEFCASIISGIVKLKKRLPDGRQQIVGLQFQTDFLGRPDDADCSFTARAATDVELCTVPKRHLQALMKQVPGLEHRLFQNTLDELAAAREWMLLLGRKTAEERVASFVCVMAQRAVAGRGGSLDDQAPVQFDVSLTRSEIADYLGITNETVSRSLARLQQRRLISIEPGRRISVSSLTGLAAVAAQSHPAR
jgi:CRP/FNR family transcriptional regulator